MVDGNIRVVHKGGDLFELVVREHSLFADQPVDSGGTDAAPTPVELFVSSLASCVALYACRYLVRHGLPTAGLAVEADFTMGERPTRVGMIGLSITIPPGVPEARRHPLLAVASHCTVHNSLEQPPEVTIRIAA